MITIVVETRIAAPVEKVFDLARNLSVHNRTTGKTQERIVEGPWHDLMELGDRVTFEARHFGVRQRLTAEIVQMEKPFSFTDRMISGAFKSLEHTHSFEKVGERTLMTDSLRLEAPFGVLGLIAEALFLRGYMRRFIQGRGTELKRIAEAI